MQRIIALLKRYRNLLYFLILQAVCFSFIVSSNNFHRAQFLNSSNAVVGWFKEVEHNVTNYFHLNEANKQLLAENALLKQRQFNGDSLKSKRWLEQVDSNRMLAYEYLPAQVISVSTRFKKNYATLNIGAVDGVDPEEQMGVVGPNGIVGYTRAGATNHYTQVVTVLHSKFLLTAIHKKSGQRARLIWGERDNRFVATMADFQNYVEVKVGDTIVTSGSTGKFPRGEFVGTVQEINKEGGTNYLRLKIKLGTDFNKLHNVYVIRNNRKIELKKLQEGVEKEEKPL